MMFAVRAAEQGRNGGEDDDDDEEARAAGCELVGCGRWAAGCGLWGCGMAVAWCKIKRGSMDDAWKDGDDGRTGIRVRFRIDSMMS